MNHFPSISIKIIPHQDQRYDTCGDWWIDSTGNWHIAISDLGDPRYNLLVALHELVEMALCSERNITPTMVDRFDIGYDGKYADDPGMDPHAPYHKEHLYATTVEKNMSLKLRVNWDKYNDVIDALEWKKEALMEQFTAKEVDVLKQLIYERIANDRCVAMGMKPPTLSEFTLEGLVLAILNLRTASNLVINLQPKDVLQDWVLKQLPPLEDFMR